MSFGSPPKVPLWVTEITSLSHIDYGDEVSVPTTQTKSAEHWARRIFGDTPNVSQKSIWHGLLRFPLHATKSPNHIAGWKIAGRGGNWIGMENQSWFMSANLICRTKDDKLSLVLIVKYEHWFGRLWWPPLAVVHRAIVPRLLVETASKKID